MASSTFTQVKDYPTPINIPENAPPYMRQYVDQVELWARDVSRAMRQLQQKVADLEAQS